MAIFHAFVSQSGRLTDLGTIGGPQSLPWLLNDVGQVLGQTDTGASIELGSWSPDSHFVAYSGVFAVGVDGDDAVRVTTLNARSIAPRWAPETSSASSGFSATATTRSGPLTALTLNIIVLYALIVRWEESQRQLESLGQAALDIPRRAESSNTGETQRDSRDCPASDLGDFV